jgi:hypothetical protein
LFNISSKQNYSENQFINNLIRIKKMNRKQKILSIVHSARVADAAVGNGLAQLPSSDMPVLCSIQGQLW